MTKGRQIRNEDSYLKNHRYTHQKRYLPAFFAPLKKKKTMESFLKLWPCDEENVTTAVKAHHEGINERTT